MFKIFSISRKVSCKQQKGLLSFCIPNQPAIACSKLTIETLVQSAKYVQSLQFYNMINKDFIFTSSSFLNILVYVWVLLTFLFLKAHMVIRYFASLNFAIIRWPCNYNIITCQSKKDRMPWKFFIIFFLFELYRPKAKRFF